MKLFIIMLFFASTTSAQNCEELLHYRDVQLKKDYDLALYRVSLYSQSVKDAKKEMADLLNHRDWNEVFSVRETMSDAMETKMAVAKAAQVFSELATTVYEVVNPAAGSIKLVGSTMAAKVTSKLTAQNVYTAISAGKDIAELVKERSAATTLKIITKQIDGLGKSAVALLDYKKQIEDWENLKKGRKELVTEIYRVEDMVDKNIEQMEKLLNENEYRVYEVKEIQKGITEYLDKHCKDKEKKDLKKYSLKRLVEGGKEDDNTPKKVITTASNFLFFATDIVFENKVFTVISNPVSYDGKVNNSFALEKEDFIKAIEQKAFPKIFAEEKETSHENKQVFFGIPARKEQQKQIKESLSTDGYSRINTYYFLNSKTKEPIKNSADCIKAIEKYKAFQQKALQEIGESPNFIQL